MAAKNDMHSHHDGTRVATPAVGHETSDVYLGGVFVFALGLLVTLVIVHLLTWMLFAVLAKGETAHSLPQYPLAAGLEDRLPPEPRLQTNPREDLRQLRAAEDAVLNSYGWVDKSQGVARMPIDEAMKLTVQRGLPVRAKQ
jgi:hypothetical protein